jgi:hypothetical protein
MTVTHKLVGYDRATEWVAAEYDLTPGDFEVIRRIVRVDPADADVIGNYQLDAPTAQEVGRIIGTALDTKRMDFFLEPAL